MLRRLIFLKSGTDRPLLAARQVRVLVALMLAAGSLLGLPLLAACELRSSGTDAGGPELVAHGTHAADGHARHVAAGEGGDHHETRPEHAPVGCADALSCAPVALSATAAGALRVGLSAGPSPGITPAPASVSLTPEPPPPRA